ncbi:MAG: MBL fold metallo-hydrolase, partial [Verrucomicrobiaceae bacterium]
GGRIVNYLKAMLGDPRHEVVFVGYQVKGTPGAVLQAGAEKVELDGEAYPRRIKVTTLTGYSAHADQAGLVEFALGAGSAVRRVVLVHGEGRAKRALASALGNKYAELGCEVGVTVPA